ncbi:unnamed protein product [Ectocarpus sp. 8 AP-2014]
MLPSSGGAGGGTGPGLPPQDDEYLQPKVLQGLEASYHMDKPGRARGLRCSVPSFTTAETESSAQTRAKAMILTIQAALPSGARLRARGRFDGGLLQPWITFVQEATTALELMEAWLLLESSINPRWLESSSKRLFSVLPCYSLALQTATYASVCLRAWVMDHCLQYGRSNANVDDAGMSEIASNMLPHQPPGRRKKTSVVDEETGGVGGSQSAGPPSSATGSRGGGASNSASASATTPPSGRRGRRLTKVGDLKGGGGGGGSSSSSGRRASPGPAGDDPFAADDDDASQHSGPPSPPRSSASSGGGGDGGGGSGSGKRGRPAKKRKVR